ncbi:hypothetical protein C8J56DRAFT_884395 [Mycena floridula]|nr:hypothetical protein C8J56DRAFT_884395 [Mycena floridula]
MPYLFGTEPALRLTFLLLLLCNIGMVVQRIYHASLFTHDDAKQKSMTPSYSYIGGDFPLEIPAASDSFLENVAMRLDETIHYDINATSALGHAEWDASITHPKGLGRVRLGPDHRVFVVNFYHQIHCLTRIREAIMNNANLHANVEHMQHCFHYIMQSLLCEASDSLEEGDFMARDLEVERDGGLTVCRAWDKVYETMDDNMERWHEWAKDWN